jgi:hypothetical protein
LGWLSAILFHGCHSRSLQWLRVLDEKDLCLQRVFQQRFHLFQHHFQTNCLQCHNNWWLASRKRPPLGPTACSLSDIISGATSASPTASPPIALSFGDKLPPQPKQAARQHHGLQLP